MNSLKNIIQRCHQRHKKPLQPKKTVVTPSVYKGLYHHFTVYCAQRYPVTLYDLEAAGISFMPLGGGPGHERVPQSFGGERFLNRQKNDGLEHETMAYIVGTPCVYRCPLRTRWRAMARS